MIYKTKLKKNRNFTIVDNEFIDDKKLSARAKGVLLFLVRMPEDWAVTKTSLFKFFSEGRDTIWNAVKELIEHKYIVQIPRIERDDSGQYSSKQFEYVVYEISIDSPRFEEFYGEPPPKQSKQISKARKEAKKKLPDIMDA